MRKKPDISLQLPPLEKSRVSPSPEKRSPRQSDAPTGSSRPLSPRLDPRDINPRNDLGRTMSVGVILILSES